MITFLTILITVTCIFLMLVILIQNPKGGGIDSTFGGGAANQMFGAARSTDFIEKLTWILAAVLIILCIVTAVVVSNTGGTEILQTEQ